MSAARTLELVSPRSARRSLRVVRRKKRKLLQRSPSSRIASIAIGAAIGVAAVVAAVLLEQVMLVQSAFKLADLRKGVLQEQDRHEELMLEAAQLDSAARIETYARDTLGMVEPTPDAIHYIVADVRRATRVRIRIPRHDGGPPGGGLATGSAFSDPYVGEGP